MTYIGNPHLQYGVVADLLLDTYTGANVAYSFRLLTNAYSGSCCRVREDGSGTETDIGFVSGVVDTAAIDSHCGVNNGYITKWYDQMENDDAFIAAGNDQPLICTAGTTEVDPDNGLPAMSFDGTNHRLILTTGVATTQEFYHHFVFNRAASGDQSSGFGRATAQTGRPFLWFTNDTIYSGMPNITSHDTGQTGTGDFLATSLRDSSDNLKYWINGTAKTTKNYGVGTPVTMNGVGGDYYRHKGYMQELIYWDTDQESNRSGIETDTNGYYSIW